MALTNSALSLRLERLALRMVGLGFVFGLLWFPGSGFAGSLSGSVEDRGGAPIPGVFIDIYDNEGGAFDFAVTDAVGAYRFDGLVAGDYYVHTDSLGEFVDQWFDQVPGAADSLFYDPLKAGATPVSVPATGLRSGVNFALDLAGAVSGRVTDAASAGVARAYVDVYLLDGTRVRSALTDSLGAYVVDGLPAGTYAVRTDTLGALRDEWHDGTVAFDSVSPGVAGIQGLQVTAGGLVQGIDFQLVQGASLEGVVTDSAGTLLPNVYVDLYGLSGQALEFARTDDLGHFRLGGLPAGSYYLGTDTLRSYIDCWYDQVVMLTPGAPQEDGATPIQLGESEVRTGLDFILNQGATISGTVSGPGGIPVADVFVDIYVDGAFFDYTITAADGSYSLSALPDQTYYVKVDSLGAYLDVWYPSALVRALGDPVADGADPIIIQDGVSVDNIHFSLEPGGGIAGAIIDSNGLPIPGVFVDLYNSDGQRLFYTETSLDGTYHLGGLPDGTYYLRTDTLGLLVDLWYSDALVILYQDPVGDGAVPLVVQDKSELTGKDLVLDQGGSIQGRVMNHLGVPLEGTGVEVYFGDLIYDFGLTDSNGVYNVSVLPAGTYFLQTDTLDGLINEWYRDVYIYNQGDPEEDGATSVILGHDQAIGGIDFVLGLGADIEGQVLSALGQPIAGVYVDVYDALGRYYDDVLTATDGTFVVSFLPPGTFYVGVDALGAYLNEWYDAVPRLTFSNPLVDGATTVATEDGVVIVGIDFALSPYVQPVAASLQIASDSEGAAVLSWMAELGVAYQVQRALQLDPEPVWQDAPSGVLEIEVSGKSAGTAGLRQYRDPAPPAGGAFYRVVVSAFPIAEGRPVITDETQGQARPR